MIRINGNKILPYFIIILLIYSKFFYLSLFSISSFNFTLTDLILIVMLLLILKRKKTFNLIFYRKLIFYSFIIALFFSLGSIIQGTSILDGLVNYLKRWLELLIIPIYMLGNFQKKDIRKITILLNIMVLFYGTTHFNSLINSLSTDRFSSEGAIAPNVWGILMAMLIIFVSQSQLNLFEKVFFISIEGVFLIATSSRGAIFSFIVVLIMLFIPFLKKLNTKKRIITSLGVLIIVVIFGGTIFNQFVNMFPYSYSRIYNTIANGILNDSSASSRISTGSVVLGLVIKSYPLLLFGTGYGNGNMYQALLNYGYNIYTADNMYINMFAWSGFVGLFIYVFILYKILMRILKDNQSKIKNGTKFSTVYLLLAGFTMESLNEPTIGSIYMILLGMYEISKTSADICLNSWRKYEN